MEIAENISSSDAMVSAVSVVSAFYTWLFSIASKVSCTLGVGGVNISSQDFTFPTEWEKIT